ncbi:MAG: hypothetical protein ACE37K_15875 [Planctomycetota bacterium]
MEHPNSKAMAKLRLLAPLLQKHAKRLCKLVRPDFPPAQRPQPQTLIQVAEAEIESSSTEPGPLAIMHVSWNAMRRYIREQQFQAMERDLHSYAVRLAHAIAVVGTPARTRAETALNQAGYEYIRNQNALLERVPAKAWCQRLIEWRLKDGDRADRRNAVIVVDSPATLAESKESVLDTVATRELAQFVAASVKKLGSPYDLIFQALTCDGLKQAEVAEKLDMELWRVKACKGLLDTAILQAIESYSKGGEDE